MQFPTSLLVAIGTAHALQEVLMMPHNGRPGRKPGDIVYAKMDDRWLRCKVLSNPPLLVQATDPEDPDPVWEGCILMRKHLTTVMDNHPRRQR